MWPYSYAACDPGTFIAQQDKDGNPTVEEQLGGPGDVFSSLPGQKLSACTCPGSDHPGPSVSIGRGVPEIDMSVKSFVVALIPGHQLIQLSFP